MSSPNPSRLRLSTPRELRCGHQAGSLRSLALFLAPLEGPLEALQPRLGLLILVFERGDLRLQSSRELAQVLQLDLGSRALRDRRRSSRRWSSAGLRPDLERRQLAGRRDQGRFYDYDLYLTNSEIVASSPSTPAKKSPPRPPSGPTSRTIRTSSSTGVKTSSTRVPSITSAGNFQKPSSRTTRL